MFRILLTLLFISGTYTLFSQDPSKASLSPCGTPVGISPWLQTFAAQPKAIAEERSVDTLWVALQLHLVGRDNGTGRFPYDRALDAFCRLNQDFAPSLIQFYFKNPINLINSTEWFAHSTIPQGIEMMLTNNAADAYNAYFVSDPAGNCGYNLPYGGVAIGHGCAAATDHTWAHESGHALSLPHPFIGWEGKTYSYSVPTPTQLTYDYTYFHDSLETQVPAPLDTALVELLSGTNCAIAADLICDSKPDYLSYRWNCDAQQQSSVKQKDPQGADFYSDGTLYMSYADDACQSRFTPEEIITMRSNLLTEKVAWLAPEVLQSPVTSVAAAIEPILGQPTPVSGAKLIWSSVPNATFYLVQASRFANFVVREVDIITSDTSLTMGNLVLNKTYYWRVKSFNSWHACTSFNESASFLTVPATHTYSPDGEGWRCYPSVMTTGQALKMEIPDTWRGASAQMRILDVAGRLVWSAKVELQSPRMEVELPNHSWSTGVYHLVLTTDRGVKQQPLFFER